MKDSITYLVQQLLVKNKIAFDKKELSFQIQSHPSFPSLHAITGVLSHFNIDNLALTVPVDSGILKQLPNNFLAQIKSGNGDDFVVVSKGNLHCTIITSNKKKEKLTNDEFLKKFTGIIVAVEKDALLESKTTKNNFDKILLALTSLLLVGLLATSTVSVTFILYFVLCAIGVFISNAIIQQEQGNQTTLGDAFCSGATEKKDCDAVISSKGALLFNRFKLSDLSFVFFTGLTLVSLLLFLQGNNLNTLYAISIAALPITIYSIYYQAIIVKKWCLLCLGIVGTLWAQAVIVLVNSNIATFSFSPKSILLTSLGFLITVTLWNYISPKIKSLKELSQTKLDYYKFKRNFNLFNMLLEKSKSIDTTISNASEIVFGNTNSPLNITVITNPFCGHCKSVHTLIEDILKKYSKDVQICVRFNINTDNPENDVVKITSRLLEIYNSNPLSCLDALHDIYGGITSEEWLNKWESCYEKEKFTSVLNKENEWCKNNNINFTPEILINGKSYPQEYDRSDLIYFIEELAEKATNNHQNELVTT